MQLTYVKGQLSYWIINVRQMFSSNCIDKHNNTQELVVFFPHWTSFWSLVRLTLLSFFLIYVYVYIFLSWRWFDFFFIKNSINGGYSNSWTVGGDKISAMLIQARQNSVEQHRRQLFLANSYANWATTTTTKNRMKEFFILSPSLSKNQWVNFLTLSQSESFWNYFLAVACFKFHVYCSTTRRESFKVPFWNVVIVAALYPSNWQ